MKNTTYTSNSKNSLIRHGSTRDQSRFVLLIRLFDWHSRFKLRSVKNSPLNWYLSHVAREHPNLDLRRRGRAGGMNYMIAQAEFFFKKKRERRYEYLKRDAQGWKCCSRLPGSQDRLKHRHKQGRLGLKVNLGGRRSEWNHSFQVPGSRFRYMKEPKGIQ